MLECLDIKFQSIMQLYYLQIFAYPSNYLPHVVDHVNLSAHHIQFKISNITLHELSIHNIA
jgi:hypothetical protein